MGCCNEKTTGKVSGSTQLIVSEEEELIKECEKSIPFTNTHISKILLVFSPHKNKEHWHKPLLDSLLLDLGFSEQSLKDPDCYEYKFIKTLQNQKRLYSYHTILLSALLLAPGNSIEKSRALFELYDKDKQDKLDNSEVQNMISEIINFSVKVIPMIAVNDEDESQDKGLSSVKVKKHLIVMLRKENQLVSRLTNVLMQGSRHISRSDFIARVTEEPFLQALLWSYLIRLALLE